MLAFFWKRFVGCFVAGVIALLPVVVTVAVVIWVGAFLSSYVGPGTTIGSGLKTIGLKIAPGSTTAYALGWVVVLGVVFGTGLLVELGAKRIFNAITDAILKRVPLVGTIYSASRQMAELFDKKDDEALKSMTAVFCFFDSAKSTGVLAFLVSPERFLIDNREYHIVIIPTAPIPFGGGMIFVPVESVRPADMPIDGLMSIYLSMGVTAPEYMTKATLVA